MRTDRAVGDRGRGAAAGARLGRSEFPQQATHDDVKAKAAEAGAKSREKARAAELAKKKAAAAERHRKQQEAEAAQARASAGPPGGGMPGGMGGMPGGGMGGGGSARETLGVDAAALARLAFCGLLPARPTNHPRVTAPPRLPRG